MTSFSIFRQYFKKIKNNLSKVLNTFENVMANGAFAPKSKCLIFHNIFNFLLSKELTAYFWHYSTFNEKS